MPRRMDLEHNYLYWFVSSLWKIVLKKAIVVHTSSTLRGRKRRKGNSLGWLFSEGLVHWRSQIAASAWDLRAAFHSQQWWLRVLRPVLAKCSMQLWNQHSPSERLLSFIHKSITVGDMCPAISYKVRDAAFFPFFFLINCRSVFIFYNERILVRH